MAQALVPLSIIYNQKSGFHSNNKESVYEQIITLWSEAGFSIQSFEMSDHDHFQRMMQHVLERHQQQPQGVVVAAGGDGTLNAVAAYLLHTPIKMGILPLGTFNYVARVLGIPLDLMEAAKVISDGATTQVHVARFNQYIYLNNASLGLYPLFIQKREAYNRYLGRFPIHAYTSGLDVLLRDRKELKLEVEVDGICYPVKTPLVFLGNNQLQLEELNLKIAQDAAQGKVAGVVVAKSDKKTLFKMLWQLMRGQLEHTPHVHSFAADRVVIHSKAKKLTLAIDGEIVKAKPPLNIWVDQAALNMVVPHVTTSL
jgi:diacylglycerol kinase family enzyme